jgi:hypothetical protein
MVNIEPIGYPMMGVRWDRVLETSPGALLKKLDSLWVGYSGAQQLYVSSDLHNWQHVDLSEANLRWMNGGTPYASAVGNTLFLLFRRKRIMISTKHLWRAPATENISCAGWFDRFGNCTFSNEELASHFSELVNWVETGVRQNP